MKRKRKKSAAAPFPEGEKPLSAHRLFQYRACAAIIGMKHYEVVFSCFRNKTLGSVSNWMLPMLKMLSWNVNGLRAVLKKNFLEFVESEKPDVLCVQETKMSSDYPGVLPDYVRFYANAEKKGYAGVATFVRDEPLEVTYGMGVEEHDREGRLITLEYDDYYAILPDPETMAFSRETDPQGGRPCAEGFRYSSDTNTQWLSVEQLRRMIGLLELRNVA